MNETNPIDKNFNSQYSIPEFSNIRKDLLTTISKTLIFLFKTTLIKDNRIIAYVVKILKIYLGNDEFNDRYLKF